MNDEPRPLLWYRSARRHRIGKRSALHVMSNSTAQVVTESSGPDDRLRWVGLDERGRELEVIALDVQDAVVVIHVFPTALRRWGAS